MKYFGRIMMVLLIWSGAENALAETLSIHQALERALLNNPGIERQRQQVESEKLGQSIAQAKRLPELGLEAGVTHYSDPTLVWPIHEPGSFPPFDDDVASVGVNLKLPLYMGGKLVASVNLAQKLTQSADLQLQASKQELIFNVVSTYGKSLQLQHLRDAMQHRILNLESQLRDVRKRFESGRVAEVDVARVKTRLSEARYEMVALEQGMNNSLQLLARLLGDDQAPTILDELPMPPLSPDTGPSEWVEKAFDKHPSLQQAQTGVQAAEQRIDIARGERLPQLHVVGNSRHLESGSGEGQDEWQLGLELSVPLFDGSARRDRVSQAVIEKQVAQFELQELRDTIDYQVRVAYSDVTTDGLQLSVTEQGLEEAKEVLRIEKLRYSSGSSTITDLLGAEADLWNARAKRTQAAYDVIISKSRLLKETGQITPELFTQTGTTLNSD